MPGKKNIGEGGSEEEEEEEEKREVFKGRGI